MPETTKAKKEVKVHFYSVGEEIFSSVSHGVGVVFSIVAMVILVLLSALFGNAVCVVSSVLYGISLILLYTCSTLYHAITHTTSKKVFRILDHCTIFLLITGTYTPLTLINMRHTGGILIFCILWGATVLGILMNSISLERFKIISLILYIIMGWCVIFKATALYHSMALAGIILIALGGVFYTGGILFYASKKKFMHSIWHLFVLAGSVLHFVAILSYSVWPQLSLAK